MISDSHFLKLVDEQVGRNLHDRANRSQRQAILHSYGDVLQIVAGPGSGKTTVLVLRALRSMLVQDVLPEHIVITTFTRKAAKELRTRWLDWGTTLLDTLSTSHDISHLDINRCNIDTLDGIVFEVLRDYRNPGELAPMLMDQAGSLLALKRFVFQNHYYANKSVVDSLLAPYTFGGQAPRNQVEALKTARRLLERLIQDRVDCNLYAQSGAGQAIIATMLDEYRTFCLANNAFDFATLEEHFLNRLLSGTLSEWTNSLRMVFIDEYQDTNPLQEAIYFSLLLFPTISATVVGDDDQSMYRFRGGSVELFTDFESRCFAETGRATTRIDMIRNFRSRRPIVKFFNAHIKNDPDFQGARINPAKPEVVAARRDPDIPVLGMFRADESTLANDLTKFLETLCNGGSIPVGRRGNEIRLSASGALGDAVFLSHSVEEMGPVLPNRPPQQRFAHVLRTSLEQRGLAVFNPRGQALRSVPDVQRLLGTLLLAIDPTGMYQQSAYPTNEATLYLNQWREQAEVFIAQNPNPNDGRGIRGFVDDWQTVSSGQILPDMPPDWPVLELIFKLIAWLPGFQSQPEHQVWLEAVTRIIASGSMASPYGMLLYQNTSQRANGPHVERSRASLIRDALIPMAGNEVDVDEDIMPSVPRDRLQFMTIHQAKGLEFPLVIVDVASRFKTNHHTQRFLRFPDSVSTVVQAEDDMEPYLAAPLRGHRSGLDRTIDDLVRLYYVAYSRPQSALVLIGNEAGLRYPQRSSIPNIALGWRRDLSWPWRQPQTGKKPPIKVVPPFQEI